MAFSLKSMLSDTSIVYPSFFFLFICLVYYFQPFTFRLYRSFVLRWVCCRQHMCGSCFLIHSAILCLLIGAFNPFIFKVIIDTYLFIAIFSYLCSSLFHCVSSCSQSKSFSKSCRLGLEEVYSLRILLFGMLLIWPSILIESLDE